MAKLVKNVVQKEFTFTVFYKDGRTEEKKVEAESKEAAFLLLQADLWDADVNKVE